MREWVLCSPHRTKRPWQGAIEKGVIEDKPEYDPKCYLCPRNDRAGDETNPDYTGTFVFDNDFSALLPGTPEHEADPSGRGLMRMKAESGLCRVIVFTPRHDLTLAQMDQSVLEGVVDLWTDQYEDLAANDEINHVMIFENKGAMMGCSNPHPHGQIWASASVPSIPETELASQAHYLADHSSSMLVDYAALEAKDGDRAICQNDSFIAVCPFWATWPYEALLLPRRAVTCLPELTDVERADLARILSLLTIKLDNLFETTFPYSMGIHQAPVDGRDYPEAQLHWHFYPPLLRSATVKKFLVGYEMTGEPQRDITPEQAAEKLAKLPDVRYR